MELSETGSGQNLLRCEFSMMNCTEVAVIEDATVDFDFIIHANLPGNRAPFRCSQCLVFGIAIIIIVII
ncbi:hypothetical protein NC652_008860 [Populus alba x Populus x berolinensis]|nr:hypothetical protein NC652_008860 [Populus alba x Populus x berolinensis]